MINMDYSADLPINTMGRRIRTRLYFTSESHLHTLLNVLRFAGEGKVVLSKPGVDFVNQTPELCYLTQVVFRLFEDTSRPMEEARRFRVEILFSPGATAPPIHLDESNKGYDKTRLDTAGLVRVERDGLTCKEIEDFFDAVILENGGHDHGKIDIQSTTTPPMMRKDLKPFAKKKKNRVDSIMETKNEEDGDGPSKTNQQVSRNASLAAKSSKGTNDGKDSKDIAPFELSSKYFWTAIAVGSLCLGAGCLVMAMSLGDRQSGYQRRHSVRRF
jgi:inositol hexakisphosphate/diphosphoinositol-pentakisphosphate kinase